EHRHRVRDRPDRPERTRVDPGRPAPGARQLRRSARGCGRPYRRRKLAGRGPARACRADEHGRALRAGRAGVSVTDRRRPLAVAADGGPPPAVVVVAASALAAARVEAMLRSRSGLRVTVSGLAELGRRVDDHARAIVVLALPSGAAVRALEVARGLPRV